MAKQSKAVSRHKDNSRPSCTSTLFDDTDIISSYSRGQAIEDGVLVDLRQGELNDLLNEAGFRWPMASTSSVFFECIDVTPAARRAGNDIKGRLWDILQTMKNAMRRTGNTLTTELFFDVLVVRDRIQPTLTKLKVVAGPDDYGRPCLTIMFPEED
jgi:uncharacterized protein DUF6573